MIRIFAILFFALVSVGVHAQENDNAFHIGWNTLKPLADNEFVNRTSSAGVRLGYTKFLDERFGFGFEAGFSTLREYIPPTTYLQPDGAITTDVYNYLYYLTITANAQYFFVQGKHFLPYASLGMGVALSNYKVFYNVYEDVDNTTGFVIRPEVGTLYKIKEYGSFGLKAAVGFDYATNKSEYMVTKNLSALNFQLGIVLFGN